VDGAEVAQHNVQFQALSWTW